MAAHDVRGDKMMVIGSKRAVRNFKEDVLEGSQGDRLARYVLE
jgi:hypothetical protein